MDLEYVVRSFLLDNQRRTLLVKHHENSPWVLPWGHVEKWEWLLEALWRELKEELWVVCRPIWVITETSDSQVQPEPLPVSIHKTTYFSHEKNKEVTKLEFWYFSEVQWDVSQLNAEIHEAKRFSFAEIGLMSPDSDVFQSTKDILLQNEDLLDLIM